MLARETASRIDLPLVRAKDELPAWVCRDERFRVCDGGAFLKEMHARLAGSEEKLGAPCFQHMVCS